MNVIRTKDGGAIINCTEMESMIIGPLLNQIFPGYNEQIKEELK